MQGGNGPQLLVNVLAERIQDGKLDAGDRLRRRGAAHRRLRRASAAADPAGRRPTRARAGRGRRGRARAEHRRRDCRRDDRADHGLPADRERDARAPPGAPVDEQLRRHRRAVVALQRGRRDAAGRVDAAGATRPKSSRTRVGGEPPVTLPYLKLLNSNIQVDQAAAVISCSAREGARRSASARPLGVRPRRRAARPTSGSSPSARAAPLARDPACGKALFEHAGVGAGDLAPVDLYSCFPAAVQLAADELGLPLDTRGS